MIGNFECYMIFYITAKHKNMTAAAAELYLSQPTVSRSVRELEEYLGCTLFIRSKKGVELTPEGELLYRHAETAYHHLESAEQKLKQYKDLEGGTLQIGATEMTLQYFLQPYLDRFQTDYPGISVRLSLGVPETLYARLKSGTIDLALLPYPLTSDETVCLNSLQEYDNVLIAGEKFRHLTKQPHHMSDLAGEPFILLPPGTAFRMGTEKYFSDNHVSVNPVCEASTMQMIITLVQSGMGIGFVPILYVREELEKGILFRVDLIEKLPEQQVCLCTNRIYPQSAACKEMVNYLTDGRM